MFYQKKKKEYSEVSESKLNINSDYFHIFQNELKNYFPTKNKKSNDHNQIDSSLISDANVKNITNVENVINNNKNVMINTTYKNVELNNNDIFFINMFTQHLNKNNK